MNKLSLVVNSSTQSVSKIEHFAETLRDQFGVGVEKYPDILISLTEAVNNAIIHGNNGDTKKQVCIVSLRTQKGITITVSDEGAGFNYSSIPDPTSADNICNCGGRGVFLMRELCDNISFVNNGSTVKLFFSL